MTDDESGPTTGHGEDGFATVWVITAMALVIVIAGAAICFGVALVQQRRAAAAADAAALSAALLAVQGPAVACQSGAAVARRDGAIVTHCELREADAYVDVAVALPAPIRWLGPAVGRARAGPAGEAPGSSPAGNDDR